MQRYGDPLEKGIRYTTRPGAYAVLVRGGQMLLTRQFQPLDEFQLPGGGIDAGEGPLRALHREVKEETGYSIRVTARLGVYQKYVFMPEYDLWARKVCHIYLGRPVLRMGPPTEPGHEPVWMDLDTATEALANDADAEIARQALGILPAYPRRAG